MSDMIRIHRTPEQVVQRLNEAAAEIERLRKLYDAAWAECEGVRTMDNLHCECDVPGVPCYRCEAWEDVRRLRIATDTTRKENGNGKA
jgi:hypothetical protein